jgi:hypothetical protein
MPLLLDDLDMTGYAFTPVRICLHPCNRPGGWIVIFSTVEKLLEKL